MLGQRIIPVLVAEDSEDNQFLLEQYCEDTPFRLSFVGNGKDAVIAFRDATFAAVLMDIEMPVMDGLTAIDLMRGLELSSSRPRTPILTWTSRNSPHDREAALRAGCDMHLTKPTPRERLLGALEQWTQ